MTRPTTPPTTPTGPTHPTPTRPGLAALTEPAICEWPNPCGLCSGGADCSTHPAYNRAGYLHRGDPPKPIPTGLPHPDSPAPGTPGKLWLATRAAGFTLFALSITTLAGLYVVAAVGGAW